jgi:hypothetical protein
MTAKYTCVHKVWGGYHYSPCGKKADESGLCGRHKLEAIKARKAKRDAKVAAQITAMHERAAKRKEDARRAACFPDLLEALKAYRAKFGHCGDVAERADDAIKKATHCE